ncbi:hypothetical protein GGR52DRAFT_587152 [Hypoxylon sp. FL1284]|nr:hypothetical protein GGR52DRAFT_587152 [Hypoxylon sp. FL1284]
MGPPPFDPRNQTFFILGRPASDGTPSPPLAVSLPTIDAQRVRLANTSISYGVQLGLILSSLLVTLLLLPSRKLRRAVHVAQAACLVVSAARLALLVTYFPGPLTEYYVAWTRDAGVLGAAAYRPSTASAALSVVQLALVEAALALQSRVLVRTWGAAGCSRRAAGPEADAEAKRSKKCWWRPPVLSLAVALAAAAVAARAVWVARYTAALRGHTLPVPLDAWGRASVITGAASVFYFCGVFFAHLVLHLAATRRVLRHGDRGMRKFSVTLSLKGATGQRGLTSLEILAVGNGILMLAPCLFAGLDIAAGPGNTRVLPFDAGSWVQTLVAAGLPLISIAAFYRGSDSADSRLHSRVARLRTEARWWPDHAGARVKDRRRRPSFLASDDDYDDDDTTTLPFSFPPRAHRGSFGADATTLTRSSSSHPTKTSSVVAAAVAKPSRSWSLRASWPPDRRRSSPEVDLEAGTTGKTEESQGL